MHVEDALVLRHAPIGADCRVLTLQAERIAPLVQPGQFVHLRVPGLDTAVLRRPFSVFQVKGAALSILYREVGAGTRRMAYIKTGDHVNLLGPLGRGFPPTDAAKLPVLIAGGYGIAALFLVAERAHHKGILFTGGASACAIVGVDEFEKLGWEIRLATEDGTLGERGLVTDALARWLAADGAAGRRPEFFACGPLGMLRAVSAIAAQHHCEAWISMDRHMGCGVGACLACVQKVRIPPEVSGGEPAAAGWKWARICTEGPVFNARDVIWSQP